MSELGVHSLRLDAGDLARLADAVVTARARIDPARAVLVGISGIGGSGKGVVAPRLTGLVQSRGLRVAFIPGDDWLAPPSIRFDEHRTAEHYYRRAMRLDEIFDVLLDPLVRTRKIDVEFGGAHTEHVESMRRVRASHDGVDVVIIEGVYLFKRSHQQRFDIRVWIDCTFETALERAMARGQENLPADIARVEYEQTYFPAQRIHAERDDPRGTAHVIVVNDHRLSV